MATTAHIKDGYIFEWLYYKNAWDTTSPRKFYARSIFNIEQDEVTNISTVTVRTQLKRVDNEQHYSNYWKYYLYVNISSTTYGTLLNNGQALTTSERLRFQPDGTMLQAANSYYNHEINEYTITGEWTDFCTGTFQVLHTERGEARFGIYGVLYYPDGFDEGRGNNYVSPDNTAVTFVLPNIYKKAKIISAPNFDDESNPTINYALAADVTATLSACITNEDETITYVPYRDIPSTATSYTFNLTAEERSALIAGLGKNASMPVKFIIKTLNGNNGYLSSIVKTFSLNNCNPSLNPTVTITDSLTKTLTGNSNTVIKYYTDVSYAINAVGNKGATITHQQISCGRHTNTAPSGTMENVESGTFVFTIADSRDFIASDTIQMGFVDYVKLTSQVQRNSATPDGKINFTIKGNYYSGSFGTTNNTLAVSYRYKVNDGSYGNWITVNPTVANNKYSFDVEFSGLNYRDTYTIQSKAVDKLLTIESVEQIIKTVPVYDWSGEDFNFNVPVTYTDPIKEVSYNITDAVMGLHNLDTSSISQIKGIVNAMSNVYNLPCEISGGSNYYDLECNMYLFGNTVRGYLLARRVATIDPNTFSGNDFVFQVEFDAGQKIREIGETQILLSGYGANNSKEGVGVFSMRDKYIYPNDGSVSDDMVGKGTFKIYLDSVTDNLNDFGGHFTFPVTLDLSKFEV